MLMVVILMMVGTGFLDQKTKAGETSPDRLFSFENDLFGKVQGGDGLLKHGKRDAEMEQGGAEHVAANAGGTIEMKMGCRHRKRID